MPENLTPGRARTGERSRRLLALVFVLAMVAAACGQKDGVHVATSGGGGTGQFVTEGGVDPSLTGDPSAPVAGTESVPGAAQSGTRTQTGTATPAGPGGGGTAGAPGAAGGGGGGALKVTGSDRTGASADKIVIGIHAPATGAAPLPTTSFEKFGDLYWRYVTEVKKEKILGRGKVQVVFRDDKYTPSSARQVCRELMDSAFVVVGGGGTDQVQACGDLANESSVPYMSAGVTERGLRGLPWYYAVSMSYKQQTDLLAQYVKNKLGGGKVGMIVTDTPNFDDAIEGWEAAVKKHGLDSAGVLKHPKGDQSWYSSYGGQFGDNGVKNVFFLSSPVDYIQFADANEGRGFQYMGVGVTQGLNAILPTGCDTVNGGIFFSPFPGLDKAGSVDPEWAAASEHFKGELGTPDDIALALWITAKAQHEMFKRYEAAFGNDLTREDFRALTETMTGIKTGIGPDLSYSADDHFGAAQVHVLQADCAAEQYKTLELFKTSF